MQSAIVEYTRLVAPLRSPGAQRLYLHKHKVILKREEVNRVVGGLYVKFTRTVS
jgi:hypothetical protein